MFDVTYVALGYLLGSFPSAYLAGKIIKKIDIRKIGDGNVGAANAFRELGAIPGLVVMVLDVCKGAATILIAQTYTSGFVVFLAGFAAVAGHIWPVFLGFKGGRGEATTSGVLVALLPQGMLILLGVAIIPFILTRNTMILGAILFAPLWLAAILMGASPPLIIYSITLPCIVGVAHFLSTRHLSIETRQKTKYMR
jgi:acyl phosphate:glycerol-3-phosphate acyltransferase